MKAKKLFGKIIVTLSMEGNIPEFEGFDAQNANTKGGLGAYFGDKLEGLADIGLQSYGFQPAYELVYKNDAYVSADYQKLLDAGIINWVLDNNKKVLEIEVNVWDETALESEYTAKVRFFRMNRGGSINYLPYCPGVFDILYTDNRIHRFTQEVVFGKAVYQFMKHINLYPDILHLNEAHTVVAASHVRHDENFDKTAIVYTNHTIVPAGMEIFKTGKGSREHIDVNIRRMLYFVAPHVMYHSAFMREDGVVDFCYAATQFADVINGVSNEHAKATVKLFKDLYAAYYKKKFTIPVMGVLNGSGDSWVDSKLSKIEYRRGLATQEEIVHLHRLGKEEAFEDIRRRTISGKDHNGIRLDPNKLTIWEVRRIVDYKSQYPVLRFLVHLICAETTESFTRDSLRELWFRDNTGLRKAYNRNLLDLKVVVERVLDLLFEGRNGGIIYGLGAQLVLGGPAYKQDWVDEFIKWTYDVPQLRGKFVYVPNSDSKLLKMQAVGADVCINNPRPLEEACGTSDQRTGRNGGINIALAGAGPVEWMKGALEQYLFGPYTDMKNGELVARNDLFYQEAPNEIFRRLEKINNIFHNDQRAFERIMYVFYKAAQEVTARAMEKRYARYAYPQAIANRQANIKNPKDGGYNGWEVERSKALIAKDEQQGLLRKMNGQEEALIMPAIVKALRYLGAEDKVNGKRGPPDVVMIESLQEAFGAFYDTAINTLYIRTAILNNPSYNLDRVMVHELNTKSEKEKQDAENRYVTSLKKRSPYSKSPVSQEKHGKAVIKYGGEKNIAKITGLWDQQKFSFRKPKDGFKKRWQNVLSNAGVFLSENIHGPPEVWGRIAQFTVIVTTDSLLLMKDAQGRVYIASSDIDKKIIYLHPEFFYLTLHEQIERFYHELFSHIARREYDEQKAMADTEIFMANVMPGWISFNRKQWIAAGLRVYYVFLRNAAAPDKDPNQYGTFSDLKFVIRHARSMGFNAVFLMPVGATATLDPNSEDSPYSLLSPYANDPRYIDWEVEGFGGLSLNEKLDKFKQNTPSDYADFAADKNLQQFAQLKTDRILRVKRTGYPEDRNNIYQIILMEQYYARKQLEENLRYAHSLGVKVGIDIPFFRTMEGVEAHFNPVIFERDELGKIEPAGIDTFERQVWGDKNKQTGLAWYNEKEFKAQDYEPYLGSVQYFLEMGFDFIRLDAFHFGFGMEGLNRRQLKYLTDLEHCQCRKLLAHTMATMWMRLCVN